MSYTLKGHRALITGGTRGIGYAIATLFVENGCEVSVTARSAETTAPGECRLRPVDLADPASLQSFVHDIAGDGFDILVNCAGINKISEFCSFENTKTSDFDLIQRVNVSAPFRLVQAVLPGMRAKNWGRIVNITSIFGVISKAQRVAYSTSKFALDGMTASLAAEVAAQGVLANCVAPGFVETDMTRSALGEKGMRDMAVQVPIGRLAQPEEIAKLVAWLASEDNTYVSGQTYIIDGGFTRV